MFRAAAILLMMCTLSISCTHSDKEALIARVGNDELTLREALAHIDTTRGSREQQLGAYVSLWIDAELIYNEAARMNMDRPGDLDERMRDLKRQLVNQSFLDQLLYSESAEINEQSLREYFDSHPAEFQMHEDMVKLRFALFKDRERAGDFISRVTRTSDWEGTLHDTSVAAGIMASTAVRYYSQHTLYPPELWKLASTLAPNDISFPVKTQTGYAVVQPLAVARQGKPAPFDLVSDEVRQRMMIERRRKKYAELLGTLRKRYRVEVFTGVAQPSDTTQIEVHD
jgi:hypothetical protein